MSFDLDMQPLLQYAYNIFGSALPMVYLFVGAAFGLYILHSLVRIARG